tara:strand:+ start:4245 stop:5363 length:1119 start_codon:yes stop_codon:yes gene_type:complete
MPQNIATVINSANDAVLEQASNTLNTSINNLQVYDIPTILKELPSGQTVEMPWEPEDSVCMETYEDLMQFPELLVSSPNTSLIPGHKLDFTTVTMAFITKPEAPEQLRNYMFRSRFEFDYNSLIQSRQRGNLIFTVKDAGKATDRMELEFNNQNKLNTAHAINGIKTRFHSAVKDRPELLALEKSHLVVGANIALSRAVFFTSHFVEKQEAFVIAQNSTDFCRNSRPTMADRHGKTKYDGLRLEGEGEAGAIVAPKGLSIEQQRLAVQSYLNDTWAAVKLNAEQNDIALIDNEYNKAEMARHQVDQTYGLKRALSEHVTARKYKTDVFLNRLNELFDGNAQGLKAMPSPEQMRIASGVYKLEHLMLDMGQTG